jgi:hypothetical protein
MADERPDSTPAAATEQIHLPGPTYLPVATAFAITIAVCGLLVSWLMVGVGVVLLLVFAFRWIRETRADIAELPLEH